MNEFPRYFNVTTVPAYGHYRVEDVGKVIRVEADGTEVLRENLTLAYCLNQVGTGAWKELTREQVESTRMPVRESRDRN